MGIALSACLLTHADMCPQTRRNSHQHHWERACLLTSLLLVLLVYLIWWQGGLVGPWLVGEVVTQTGSYADAM
jgi:hypothetical protein